MDIQAIIFGRDAVNDSFIFEKQAKETFFILQKRGYKLAAVEAGDGEKSLTKSDILLGTAKTLGVPPHECAVVENAESGLDAAKRNGMTAIGIGKAKNYILADMCIGEISELLDIFA